VKEMDCKGEVKDEFRARDEEEDEHGASLLLERSVFLQC
jgi:hypothetical protein